MKEKETAQPRLKQLARWGAINYLVRTGVITEREAALLRKEAGE